MPRSQPGLRFAQSRQSPSQGAPGAEGEESHSQVGQLDRASFDFLPVGGGTFGGTSRHSQCPPSPHPY